MPAEVSTIFRGEHLMARLGCPESGSRRLVVTFDHYVQGKMKFEDRQELFFTRHGVAHMHIFTSCNNWFQSPDASCLAEIMRKVAQGFNEVVAHGSSMGAYGALIFSGVLKASRVYAFSPQFSIDPDKVPFESRWMRERAALQAFLYDDMKRLLCHDAAINLFYDPFHRMDSEHARLIQEVHPNAKLIRIPFAGHPATHVLKTLNLLGKNCIPVLFGDASPNIALMWRGAKRRSVKWKLQIIMHLLKQDRDERVKVANHILEKAYLSGDFHPENLFQIGKSLFRHEDFRVFGLLLMENAILKKKDPPPFWQRQMIQHKQSLQESYGDE